MKTGIKMFERLFWLEILFSTHVVEPAIIGLTAIDRMRLKIIKQNNRASYEKTNRQVVQGHIKHCVRDGIELAMRLQILQKSVLRT